MEMSEVQRKIGDFMSQTFLFEFNNGVNVDTDLFEAGLIDSFGFIELVGFIEDSFSITLTDEDLAAPEMATLGGTSRLVASRATGAEAGSAS